MRRLRSAAPFTRKSERLVVNSLVVFASGGALVGLIILLALYFVPAIVAFTRHHHNQWAIFALNLLLGWTQFGVDPLALTPGG